MCENRGARSTPARASYIGHSQVSKCRGREQGDIIKIVVIGGTGLIGSKLVKKLREQGHEAIAAAANTGVNSLTGGGLAEALKGAGGGG